MMCQPHSPVAHSTDVRVRRILDPAHPLCRDDVIWMLGYIKKKVADGDPLLSDLSQPRLMHNFLSFAEAAMALLQRKHYCDQEADRIRHWLREAAFGLMGDDSSPL
ncbi:hypothetical protein M6D81_09735 [Paenibacillus sp. J5C_2022]|uniref:hypothetical protein n=1 Tax=Paenibacillus sp. J5C2022 TaxID=2977129 RepID=UPI0021D0EA58|nr:hypothetical protein [Paenibacillus sp. J5C2022]MCU6709000.1 hypothetical protein [Paenibacillus sp. J5C2022]